ncbi:MAG: EAL domain-containing protein [Gammaproteobacteria bacterium]
MRIKSPTTILPQSQKLLWYVIESVLGEGGFGITYAGFDTNLQRRVAIKEFFPRQWCARDTLLQVVPHSETTKDLFVWGLRRFLQEARTLAHFYHPNIVQVRTAFEHNGTAYMVMDLEEGVTLEDYCAAGDHRDEQSILDLIGPLLHGIAKVHEAGFIHRDVKLNNIIVREDGTPVLVDFGSARQAPDAGAHGLTALVSRGFAPFEQYAGDGEGLAQGPWSDIYGLAAVLYILVTGRIPADALTRSARLTQGAMDPLMSTSEHARIDCSRELLAAIDRGLAFSIEDRPATVDAWLPHFPSRLNVAPSERVLVHGDEDSSRQRERMDPGPERLSSAATLTDAEPTGLADAIPMEGLRVLVVDDEAYIRTLAQRVLDRLGIGEHHGADGGATALETLTAMQGEIDVVLLDLKMPGMDGIEFLHALAETPYRPDIVLLSGVEQNLLRAAEEFARSNGLSVLGGTRKPIRPDDLRRVLVKYVRTQPAQPAMPRAGNVYELTEECFDEGLSTGALVPYYQPKVVLATGRVSGVEALSRWRLPDGSLLSPDAFIPFAERTGRIHALTLALMRSVFADCGDWLSNGIPLEVAVNVAPVSFNDPHFPELIDDYAAMEGIASSQIIIEVTERTITDDVVAMLGVLMRLRLRGITLSIDDFGTGYSSLKQLHKMPFTEIKIDRAFVCGAADDERARSILKSSIELAKRLDLNTIAEGVETSADLDIVRALGCDMVQGFYYAKPMPGAEFLRWLADHEAGQ